MGPVAMMVKTHYARNGDTSIAYQVLGSGPRDLVFVMGWISHLDTAWEEPRFARFLRRLASFARVICFDQRGTGLSDPVPLDELPTLDQRLDDILAVMDAAGSEQATLFGASAGGPLCSRFAATYPERTASLIMYGGYAKRVSTPDYPWAPSPEERQHYFNRIEHEWGGAVDLSALAPSAAGDEAFRSWWASWLRHGASPGIALALARINSEIDVRQILPAVRVPTLVLHRTGDRVCPAGGGRYLAERIPGARYVELPGVDHLPFVGDQDAILDEIEHFLTGTRPAPIPDRDLATLLVIELAAAAESAVRLGDRQWGELRQTFRGLLRDQIGRHRGRETSPTLDGTLAVFDGPDRAVRCAEAIVDGARRLGVAARAGLHTGEVAFVGDDVAGVAVHLTARIAALANPGEILVSNTVKDLIGDANLDLESAGARAFPGLPGTWRLYRLAGTPLNTQTSLHRSLVTLEASRPASTLSRREREVASLLALGLSNRQVADELVISVATTERHVANILTKLGYNSRAQVAAWAAEQGLMRLPSQATPPTG